MKPSILPASRQNLPRCWSNYLFSALRNRLAVLLAPAVLFPCSWAVADSVILSPSPMNIAPTATLPAAVAKVEVVGQPRVTKGHPCTLWDSEDIADYKKMLKTSKLMQEQFAAMQARLNQRITEPLGVPEPHGKGVYVGDLEPFKDKKKAESYWGTNHKNASDIADLGILYALTGDAKYGDYCKKILLAYAAAFPNYGYCPKNGAPSFHSAIDGRLTGQFLEDGGWLIRVGFGYDLVYNLPSWTPQEREAIHKNLFKPIVDDFRFERFKGIPYLNDPNNRSAVYAAATLIAGYGTEDPAMISDGLYGVHGTKEKSTGGIFGTFFTPQCISPDGLWAETIGYQISLAGSALIDHAEVLWHHGIDMYRYNNCLLKRIFDSPIQVAYPDEEWSIPETGDTTSRLPISTSGDAVIYEYAYRRYLDPLYLPIVNKVKKSLSMTTHQAPMALLYNLDATPGPPSARHAESVNFFDNGLGVLRVQAGEGINQLLMLSGPSRSHGHPDKLTIDLFALGDVVLPDPGVIFPYQDPLDAAWYDTTLACCALTVDEKSQICFGTLWQHKGAATPMAPQLVFGPASTMGIQRARTDNVYPGVNMDRGVFLTQEYMADLFGAAGHGPHKYDLAWHLRGQLTSDLQFQPMTFPEPVADGYKALGDACHANTNKGWSATVARNGKQVRLLAAGGIDTEIVTGIGHYRGAIGYSSKDELPPAILERRAKDSSTLFGNAVDISGTKEGYLKSVTQEGGIEAGYGLLRIQTVKGADLCFVAYRPSSYKVGELETDALQALVLMDGDSVRSMYLAGGRILKTPRGVIARSEPGLAFVEKTSSGTYIVANPSPADATVTVTLPALQRLSAFNLDAKGQRAGTASVKSVSPSSFAVQLKAASKVEFAGQ